MARISTYTIDSTIEGSDKLLGTDANSSSASVNFGSKDDENCDSARFSVPSRNVRPMMITRVVKESVESDQQF